MGPKRLYHGPGKRKALPCYSR
ncbi:hypothetical protein OOU_Y34scaffold00637g1 [Pyricularia oryzae Y34]|uniref:Uncharacterized protein n=2 Tax=Pyricularia oryzae TaxID=318829 RepID=A0AA97NUZ1_PYRO3|nr:hypothetical protein OOU_Y34scaffold00637g1 [Pyricularia oryzae Y34]